METLEQHNAPKKKINKIFIVAFIIAAVFIGGAIWVISLKPSMQEQVAQNIEAQFVKVRPNSPR